MATAELIVERELASAQPWRLPARIPELDGVRGFAMFLMLICHSSMWLPPSPWRSVLIETKLAIDLFFILSGFLITGILLDTRNDTNAIRNFYIRRGLRIWPLYFAFLLVAFVPLRRMVPPHLSAWVYLLFAQNFFYVANTGPLLDPTWSLGVEEQFYLAWPWIAMRVRRDTLLKICCAVLGLSPVVRCVFRLGGADPTFIYANTLCRMDGIAMGGAIAAWMRAEWFDAAALRRFAWIAGSVGVLGTGFCFASADRLRFAEELRGSFVTVGFGGAFSFALLLQGGETFVARTLRSFTFTGLGRISFALYLFNLPIYTAMHGHTAARLLSSLPAGMEGPTRLIVGNALLLLAAICSWNLYESPMLRLKSRWAPSNAKAVAQ